MQEANKRRVEEDQRRRMAGVKNQLEEQRATLCIRRVVQKVRVATPENLDSNKQELDEVLAKEMLACGTQAARMKQEAEQAWQQASARVEKIKEQQKKAEEERLAMEKKRKEAAEKADKLLKELEAIVTAAEASSKTLKEEAEPFRDGKELDLAEANATAKAVEDAGGEAQAKIKVCTDHVLNHGSEMRVPDIPGAEP